MKSPNKKDYIDFWIWFQNNANDFYFFEEKQAHHLLDGLLEHLHRVHPQLTFELGKINSNQKRELVISAGGIKSVFPYVLKLISFAPTLDDWEFIAFRQRNPKLCEVNMGDFKLSIKNIYFDYNLDKHKVHLLLFIKDYNEDEAFIHSAFVLLDHLLGEFDVETRIGHIEFYPLEEKPETALELEDLPMIIDEYFRLKHQ